MSNQKIYGFTFGDKGQFSDFRKSKFRLQKEALDTGWFDDFFCFGIDDIKKFPNDKKCPGLGYWFWKPALALELLNTLEENSIVIFLDAGNGIFKNENSQKRFFEYIDICNSGPGILIFRGDGPKEIQYTKRDTLILMGCDSDFYLNSAQAWAGAWFLKNNEFCKNFVKEWYDLCSIHHVVNWEKSYNEEYPEFKMHRFEQSVLSLLSKKKKEITAECYIHSMEISEDIQHCDPHLLYPIKSLRIADSRLGDPDF